MHDGVSIGRFHRSGTALCYFLGFGGRIGSDPSLGVGFLAHACSGGPITPNHTPQTCQKSVGLGGSAQFKDVCFSSGSASGLLLTLDCIVSPETHHQYKNGPSLEIADRGSFLHSPFLRGATSAF